MATSDWARKRQILYGIGVLTFFLILIVPPVLISNYQAPNCFDGKLNQGEVSTDRGGPCVLLDSRQVQPHAVLWARSFPVREGFYNAVAYIENPNENAGVFETSYQFKLYDSRNILIAERYGVVPVFPGKVFPIFESRIDTGNRIPARTFFSFTSDFAWERISDPTSGISIIDEKLSGVDSSPRIDATVRNRNLTAREDIVIVATLFDTAGNAIASSRTLVDRIEQDGEVNIAFTWPRAFVSSVARIDIVPLALPKRTK